MGLFNKKPGFIKPGKGVERNQKKKNAFFRFFELLYRKFSKLFVLNIIYAICILPVICGVIVFITGAFQISDELVRGSFLISNVMHIVSNIPPAISITLLCVDIIFFGPLTAGFTYMLRNYANERHAWLSDFFSRAMSNFKQGMVFGLIDVGVFLSVMLYIAADFSGLKGSGMYYFYTTLKTTACIIAIFYVFMRYYIYTLTVTFELSIKDILKNSAIFAVLGFFRNIIASIAITSAIFAFTSAWIIDMILLLTFLFSFCGFIGMFSTYPVLQKYMLPEEREDEEFEEELDISDVDDM